MLSPDKARIGIVGLGYVGLPLAVEFGKVLPTVGFDISQKRIEELKGGRDSTLEVKDSELVEAGQLSFSSEPGGLESCNVYIVTVPTPINQFNRPDLLPLKEASRALGEILKPDDIVIFESTVFPGATEDVCVPIMERRSGLEFNRDFFVFKENCPDLRNTRVVDVITELQSYNVQVDVYDPWVNVEDARHEYDIDLTAKPDVGSYDAIILAVAHDEFRQLGAKGIRAFGKLVSVLYDVKHVLPVSEVDGRL